ncbi:unnamed protein product [Schistocephalus solidus]|uniref:GMC_OxRdtase_N domain-containing protein n=1 Tax=Schistocephalus solidus TaxID=70667 RepID=A0A183S9E6_SCHSO|nr:unnamed protein product [Schistocephalus solidus]
MRELAATTWSSDPPSTFPGCSCDHPGEEEESAKCKLLSDMLIANVGYMPHYPAIDATIGYVSSTVDFDEVHLRQSATPHKTQIGLTTRSELSRQLATFQATALHSRPLFDEALHSLLVAGAGGNNVVVRAALYLPRVFM